MSCLSVADVWEFEGIETSVVTAAGLSDKRA